MLLFNYSLSLILLPISLLSTDTRGLSSSIITVYLPVFSFASVFFSRVLKLCYYAHTHLEFLCLLDELIILS